MHPVRRCGLARQHHSSNQTPSSLWKRVNHPLVEPFGDDGDLSRVSGALVNVLLSWVTRLHSVALSDAAGVAGTRRLRLRQRGRSSRCSGPRW